MAKFKDIIITDLGQHALNEAITGHTKITFTKAVLASDDVASKTVQDVKAITTLDNQKETSVALLSSQNGAIVLSVTYDNDGLTKDIIFNSVGWYAMTDSTEFLFAVSRYSQPQYLTAVPPDTDETQSITLQVSLAVGQGNVQVVQTQAGVAMKADLSRAIKDWDNSIQQLTDIKADKSQVASDLAKKADQSSVDASVKSINDVLATKANSSDVSDELALKANQSDLEKTNAEVAKKADSETINSQLDTKADKTALADYAKASDLTSDVKSLNDLIATKADAETVSNAISKIDFTPYAKSVDVNKQVSDLSNQEKADIASVNKVLAGKQDAGYSYSKAELDKKLLAMSSDTDGKIDATQVQNMIAGKANTVDVNNQIASINNAINQLTPDTHAPQLQAGFDLNSFFTGWRRSVNTQLKNAPFGWVNDTMYFQGKADENDARFELALYIGDGSDTNPKIAYRYWGWNQWKPWILLADSGDISNLQSQVSDAKNTATQANSRIDAVLGNSYFRKQGMNANGDLVEIRGNGAKQSNGGYSFDIWSSDWTASKLKDVMSELPNKANSADVNNQLAGKANTGDVSALQGKVNVDTDLFRTIDSANNWGDIFGKTGYFNALTSLRINPTNSGLVNSSYSAGIGFGGNDTKGVLSVDYSNHDAVIAGGNNSENWSEHVAWQSNITNLQNQINNKANASDLSNYANASDLAGYAKSTDVASKAQITDLQNQISELKESNFEVQTFKDEASGKAWEAQKAGHRLAIIQS